MKSFAGFWVDGAVRQPIVNDANKDKRVVVRCKMTGSLYTQSVSQIFFNYYWLDTTTPTELTPQQAFELYKTIYPDAKRIYKTQHGYSVDLGKGEAVINWGDATEYPPQKKWRVPTDADKGKKCRCKHKHDDEWKYDRTFIVEYEGKFLARANLIHRIVTYSMCEVLDE